MGSTTFQTVWRGRTAEEAFREAVAQAQYEHGHGGYSGTIAEKHSFAMVTLPDGMKVQEYINKVIRNYDKHDPALCIMGKTEIVKRQVPKPTKSCEVKKDVTKGRKVWETKYQVVDKCNDKVLAERTSQTEALKLAKQKALQLNREIEIRVVKRLTSGSPVLASVKPKKSKAMQTVRETINTYVFFGWASE